MKTNQLRNLLAVAEHGSLRAASRHLGIAQPAITRSIRELERELGVPLFERQTTGVIPTPMGRVFIQRARAAQNELTRARDEIELMKGAQGGSVSACLSTAPQIALLPDTLKPFRNRYPDVKLDLTESLFPSADPLLRDNTLDFYVGPLPEQPLSSDFLSETLFTNQRVILARKGHPQATAKSLKELQNCEWITTATTVKPELELGPLFETYNLPYPRIMMKARSALGMIMAVAHSDLLMMLPMQWAEQSWLGTILEEIKVVETLPGPAICLVHRVNLPLTPAAEYFCDLIRRASVRYQK
jgi:DNA-binding transcriptional LysR family regulator